MTMSRPVITESKLLVLHRAPDPHHTRPVDAETIVSVCELRPPGAPPSVRKRYLRIVRAVYPKNRRAVAADITIRPHELPPILEALRVAHSAICPETFIGGAGI